MSCKTERPKQKLLCECVVKGPFLGPLTTFSLMIGNRRIGSFINTEQLLLDGDYMINCFDEIDAFVCDTCGFVYKKGYWYFDVLYTISMYYWQKGKYITY